MRALVGLRPSWPRTVTSHAAEVSAAASDGAEAEKLAKAKELLARGVGILKMEVERMLPRGMRLQRCGDVGF